MAELLFYLMAIGVVGTAVGVVVARSPVVSVVSLLGSFFCLSVIYLLAGYQFLAALQILVYGGAIMVLFLFVVMLLNLGDVTVAESHEEPLFRHSRRAVFGLAVAVAMGAVGLIAVLHASRVIGGQPIAPLTEAGLDPLDELALAMFTRYSLPFEAASVLLLATAVGVMVIAKRNRPNMQRPLSPQHATAGPPTAPLGAPESAPPVADAEPRTEREEVLS